MPAKNPFLLGHDRTTGEPVIMPDDVRKTSLHVIGAPNTGKSKFLEGLLQQDILNGEGVCLIDPHGQLFERLVNWCETANVAAWRKVLVIDPTSRDLASSFNPLAVGRYEGQGDEPLTLDFCISAITRAIAQAWREYDTERTPRLRRLLYSLLHPLADEKLTILEAYELLAPGDDGALLRNYLARRATDHVVGREWQVHVERAEREFREMFDSTYSRLFEMLKAPVLRRIVGQERRGINFLKLMNERWIVLVNLAGGGMLGDDNARFLGALLVNDLFLAARCRDEKTGASVPFHVYIDECSEFLNEDVARILTEARKFGLHLVLAHQDLAQLRAEGERVYKAVMGSARTKIVFALEEEEDAETMALRIYRNDIDLEEPKHALDKPVAVGFETITLQGSATSDAMNETDPAESEATNYRDGSVTGRTEATSQPGRSRSRGTSSSRHEAREAVLAWLPTAVYSLEEQRHRRAVAVAEQLQRHAIVKMPGERAREIEVPPIRGGFATPERCVRFKRTHMLAGGAAAPVEQVEREIIERRRAFLEHAKAQVLHQEPTTAPPLRPEDDWAPDAVE